MTDGCERTAVLDALKEVFVAIGSRRSDPEIREQVHAIDARLAQVASEDQQWSELLTQLRANVPEPSEDPVAVWDGWRRFEAACAPVAAIVHIAPVPIEEVARPENVVRSVYHVLNAVAIIALVEWVLVTDGLRLTVAITGFTLAWSMELARRVSPRVNGWLMRLFAPVAHPHEAHAVNSATWYTTAILILAVALPVWAGVAGLAVLGLGDPFAAVIGRRFGRTRLASGRSLEGSLAFVVAGAFAAALALWAYHPDQPGIGFVAVCAAVGGAIGELMARQIDDNLLIPLSSAVAAVGGAALWGLT